MEYLIKASAVIAIFYICYKLFLQRDTFFQSNRGFLLLGLIIAFIIPFAVIPIYIEYSPIPIQNYDLSGNIEVIQSSKEPFNILEYLPFIYLTGIIIFAIRFLIQLASLSRIIITNKSERQGDFKFVETTNNVSPFSFFNWIVYNPRLFRQTELEQIITHEKVHAKQYHSIDILLTQLSCIILWFNPLIWFYNKDLKQNLEFIADNNAQRKSNCRKSYQQTLLKTSMPSHQMALSNNFYNSLIKKRIVMLQKSKSKKASQIKYLLVIPLLVIFLMSFNTKKVYIEKEIPALENSIIDSLINSKLETPENIFFKNLEEPVLENDNKTQIQVSNLNEVKGDLETIIISKTTTKAELAKVSNNLKEKDIIVKFKSVKRNDAREIIEIKINVSSKKSSANYSVSSGDAIKPIKITIKNNGENISISNTNIHKHEGNTFYFKSKDDKHKIHKSGKGKSVFVFSDDDGNHEVHEIHGDTLIYNSKGKYPIKLKKAKIITDDEYDEDVIIFKEGGKLISGDSILFTKLNNINYSTSLRRDSINESPWKVTIGRNAADLNDSIYLSVKSKTLMNKNLMTYSNSLKSKNKGISFSSLSSYDGNIIYMLDGDKISQEELQELNSNNIESITVQKGDLATLLHGKNSKKDVIHIKSKNYDTYSNGLTIKNKGNRKTQIKVHSEIKPLYIVDGEEVGEIVDISPDDIESVHVLKGDSAIEKYGEKGKDGVVEITLKGNVNSKKIIKTGFKIKPTDKDKRPLFIVDGKEISQEESEKLNPDNIKSMHVIKDEKATKKYGKKGKNGVIEITTKKKN